ncbi:MAG: PEP-CTERM sorting domain-containing protein [Planctomycetaceae bacterium]
MIKQVARALALAVAVSVHADVVTQWNFKGASTATVPGGTASPTAAVGAGTASLIGGVTATFASGAASGGSSDPVTTAPPNYAWNTTSYGVQGSGSGERGVQFNVSTVGFYDISVSWDTRHSNTSSRFVQFQYSLDGTTFSSSGLLGDGIFSADLGGDAWYNGRTVSLAGIASASNNASFAFRIVAIFAPGTSGYVATTGTSTWAGSGTLRHDMVTVSGVVPAPGALAVLGLAGLAGTRRRR